MRVHTQRQPQRLQQQQQAARMHQPLKTNTNALHTYVGAKCLWTLPSALAMT